MNRNGGHLAHFFAELSTGLDDARQSDQRRYLQFFAELSPRLDTAKALERDLDRHLARRFNVFDYVDTLEVGLSRIIADLLNPEARHGQGTLFLATLLEELTEIRDLPDLGTGFTKPIRVVTERVITNRRRLDISVEIPGGNGPFCLAIENKPYAEDQPDQVKDYLDFLEQEYSKRFLLIYLSPTGEGPTEWSLPRKKLDRWKGRLAIMAYRGDVAIRNSGEGASADLFDDFRVELSLANWFAACRHRCEADRLRWFLRDAEAFCQRQFGGHSMVTDSETRAMREYLFSNPNHLGTAQAVWGAWLDVKATLCGGFLEHLRTALHARVREELSGTAPDVRVVCKYGGEKGWSNFLWLYRASWSPWENHHKHPPYEGCTAIVLQSGGPGPNGWRWGVLHPLDKSNMTSADKERRARLEERLRSHLDGGQPGGWWPYLRQVDGEMANWNTLLPDLYRERNDGSGPITDYYVDSIMDIATKAIPIINELEADLGVNRPDPAAHPIKE